MPTVNNLHFVNQDKFSQALNSLVAEELEKRAGYKRGGHIFSPDHLTECDRRMVYRARDERPISQEVFVDYSNDAIRQKWIRLFQKCGFTRVIDDNSIVADFNYNIQGVIDLVLEFRYSEDNDVILPVKIFPLRHEDYVCVQETAPFKKHLIDLMVNMWLIELNNGILIYEDKNTNQYSIFHINQYAPIINAVMKKCSRLLEFQINDRIPKRSYKNNTSRECTVCEFKNTCWKQEEK